MSTRLMGQCWDLQMPPSAKIVLMSLADQGNDAGVCWPSIGTIAKRTCLSDRTVRYAIGWLRESGILDINHAAGRSSNYQINPSNFGKVTAPLFEPPKRGDPGTPAPFAALHQLPGRGARVAGGAAAGAPRTVKNRQGTNTPPPPKGEPRDGFDAFWKAFPAIGDRKAAKPQCLAKWIKLECAPLTDRILAALEAQKKLPKWHEEKGRFIPAPLVWLNQRRWEATEETAAQAGEWWETRAGAEAQAKLLGLGKWDETVPFSQYVGSIKKALSAAAKTNS